MLLAVPAASASMPELQELAGAVISVAGGDEDFLWLHIQKSQAHGAVAHDAFEVSDAAATAVALLGVERDDHVARLPDAVVVRMAAVADAVTEVPDAHEVVHGFVGGGDAGGQRVGIVDGDDRHIDAVGLAARRAVRRRRASPFNCPRLGDSRMTPPRITPGKPAPTLSIGPSRASSRIWPHTMAMMSPAGMVLRSICGSPGSGYTLHIAQFGAVHDSRPQMPGGQHSDAPSHQPS